jgi:hypothetical protein
MDAQPTHSPDLEQVIVTLTRTVQRLDRLEREHGGLARRHASLDRVVDQTLLKRRVAS